MPTYNIHIYREMRALFNGITADTPEAAAKLASEKPNAEADLVEECDGRDFAALVDVVGDEEFGQSEVVDFPQPPSHLEQAMHGMLQAAVGCWGEAVKNDEPINGADAVDWLSRFITAALPLVDASTPTVGATDGQNHYKVSWKIDIWADTPEEAAEKALLIQRRQESTANVFEVTEGRNTSTVDLGDCPVFPSIRGPV